MQATTLLQRILRQLPKIAYLLLIGGQAEAAKRWILQLDVKSLRAEGQGHHGQDAIVEGQRQQRLTVGSSDTRPLLGVVDPRQVDRQRIVWIVGEV